MIFCKFFLRPKLSLGNYFSVPLFEDHGNDTVPETMFTLKSRQEEPKTNISEEKKVYLLALLRKE